MNTERRKQRQPISQSVYFNFSETIKKNAKKDESNIFRRFRPFNVFHPKYFPISLYTVHRCTMQVFFYFSSVIFANAIIFPAI